MTKAIQFIYSRFRLQIVLGLVSLIPFLDLIFSNSKTLLVRDLFRSFGPAKSYWQQTVLSEWQIPYWNSMVGGGVPYLAELGLGPLYPANLLFLAFDRSHFFQAFNCFIVSQILFVFFSWYLVANFISGSKYWSLIFALSVSWSSVVLGTSSTFNLLSAHGTAGIFFYFYLKMQKTFSMANLFFLSFPIALAFYAGSPEYGLIFGLIATFRLVCIYKVRGFVFSITLALFSILCAAAQIFPSLEYLLHSSRGVQRLNSEIAQFWSFHPIRMFEFIFNVPFGSYRPFANYFGTKFVNGPFSMPLIFSYGIGSFSSFILILNYRTLFFQKFFWAAIAFGLIGLGVWSPIYKILLEYVPFWNLFRYPEKFLLLSVWFVWLCSLNLFPQLNRIKSFFLPSIIALLMAILLLFSVGFSRLSTIALPCTVVILLLFLWGNLFKHKGKIPIWRLLPVALIISEVFVLKPSLIWPVDINNMQSPVLTQILATIEQNTQGDSKSNRLSSALLSPDRRIVSPSWVEELNQLDPVTQELIINARMLIPDLPIFFNIPITESYECTFFPTEERLDLWRSLAKTNTQRLFDVFGAYFLPKRNILGEVVLDRNESAVDRFGFVENLITGTSFDDSVSLLSKNNLNRGQTAITRDKSLAGKYSTGRARLISSSSRSFDFEVSISQSSPSFFYFNESFDKNWHAKLGNQPLEISKINEWSMGILLPTGPMNAILRLEYSSPWISFGRYATVVWLAILAFLLFKKFRSSRKH